MFNQAVQIDTDEDRGMWRVVSPASSKNDFNVLIFIPEVISDWKKNRESNQSKMKWLLISPSDCRELIESDLLKRIEIHPHPKLRVSGSELVGRAKEIREKREEIMRRLINPMELTACLKNKGSVFLLVKEAVKRCSVSKKHVYELFTRLCWYGFETGSLNPRYYNCGAPGVARPWDESRPKVGPKPLALKLGKLSSDPQIGMTETTTKMVINYFIKNKDPAKSFKKHYNNLILKKYVSDYYFDEDGRQPIVPPKGSFPNEKQVLYALSQNLTPMEKLALKFYRKDWIRNHRGLIGHSWEGVSGPGHRYVIDATIADIYLRSQINPAWIIGRPIVYFIVDTWSTAIVAFHLCLSGPSWHTAKVSLFNLLNPELAAKLWGCKFKQCLFPQPQLPFDLMSDRGEHLSKRAAESAKELGYNQLLNPSYEPDKKGLVEVFNRIAKDVQYGEIPGAIDSRRRAVEARTNQDDGIFTMRDYYKFIQGWVDQYNLHADKTYRLTDEMIATGLKPTPADLWKYGFEQMMGYGKSVSFAKSIIHLLPSAIAAVNKKGVYLRQLEYISSEENEWTAIARNLGSFEIKVHYFPGAVEMLFYFSPFSAEVIVLRLSSHAKAAPIISHEDWFDSVTYSRVMNGDNAYLAFVDKLRLSVKTADMVDEARNLVKAAQLANSHSLPVQEARNLEKDMHGPELNKVNPKSAIETVIEDPWKIAYEELMDKVLQDDLLSAGGDHDQ